MTASRRLFKTALRHQLSRLSPVAVQFPVSDPNRQLTNDSYGKAYLSGSIRCLVRGHLHGTFGSTSPRSRCSGIGGHLLLSPAFPDRLDVRESLALVVVWNFS